MLTKKAPAKTKAKIATNSTTILQNADIVKQIPVPKSINNTKTVTVESKTNASPKKNQTKTKIIVQFDAGFSNELYIRGSGADLKWNKGQKLINVKSDEWVWESNASFSPCEFKILLNDHTYENGENHPLNEGATIRYTPKF